jgi:Tfp pilus assembly protein PilZ
MVGNRNKRSADETPESTQSTGSKNALEQSTAPESPADINDPRNRRNHDRVDVQIRGIVENELGPEASDMLMSNLSVGGCFLRCKTPESPGNLVMVRFSLPGSDEKAPLIKAVGRVAWIRRGEDAGMGIQFLRVDDGDLTNLHRYIAGVIEEDTSDSSAEGDDSQKDRRAA